MGLLALTSKLAEDTLDTLEEELGRKVKSAS